MKRILSMVMIIGMVFSGTVNLCFGDDDDASSVDVSVSASISEAFDVSEKIEIRAGIDDEMLTVSDLVVTNKTQDKTITIESIQAEQSGEAWTLTSSDAVENADANTKYIYLSMDGSDLQQGYTPASNTITGYGVSRTFQISGTIPKQTHTMSSTEVAKLVVTISLSDAEVSGSGSGGSGGSGSSSGSGGDASNYTIDQLKQVKWSTGTNAEIAAVVKALDAGELDRDDLRYWYVGAEREVELGDLGAAYSFTDSAGKTYTGTNAALSAQTVKLTIWDDAEAADLKTWTDDDGRTHSASFIVGMKLDGQFTSATDWSSCALRYWLNSTFYKAMLNAMGLKEDGSDNFFKLVYNVSDSSGALVSYESYDFFAIPSFAEVSYPEYVKKTAGCQSYAAFQQQRKYLTWFTIFMTSDYALEDLDMKNPYIWARATCYSSGYYPGAIMFTDGYTQASGRNRAPYLIDARSNSTTYSSACTWPFGCI